jgi:hypothetical protein
MAIQSRISLQGSTFRKVGTSWPDSSRRVSLTFTDAEAKTARLALTAFRATFICWTCIISFFLAGVLLAIRAHPSTDGRTAFKALLISSYAESLIIAPYNAQVFELQERIPGARIGTVDKFQGQEAPIVIYSMTTSSHADAPRGMEFLYSSNRLNVATSRAKCICVLVGSPLVFEAECRTPRHMQLANAFCRYLEMATRIY